MAYSSQAWIKNQGATSFYFSCNISNITVPPGTFALVMLPNTIGNGTTNYDLQIRTVNIGDSIDCVCWHPQGEALPYCTSYQAPADGARAGEADAVPYAGLLTQAGPWSIRTRYKVPNPVIAGTYRYLFGWGADANNLYAISLNPSGQIRIQVRASSVDYQPAASAVVGADVYVDIVFVNDGSTVRQYHEGAATGAAVAFSAPVGSMPSSFYIGSEYNGNSQCGGYLDDFQIFSRALTATEVAAMYALGAPSQETPDTVAMIKFNNCLTSDDKLVQFSGKMDMPTD